MASGIIQGGFGNLRQSSGVVTFKSDYIGQGSSLAMTMGPYVFLSIACAVTATITNQTVFAQVNDGFRPSAQLQCVEFLRLPESGQVINAAGNCYVRANGEIFQNMSSGIGAGNRLQFLFIYKKAAPSTTS